MSKEEDKKSISTISVVKKTETVDNQKKEEIGVEADIPVEDDVSSDSINLSNVQLKNILEDEKGKKEEKKNTETTEIPPSGLELKENRVKVFDMSSGRVIEKDLSETGSSSYSTLKDSKKAVIDTSVVDVQKKAQSAIKTSEDGSMKKWLLIGAGIILLLIVLYLILKGNDNSKSDLNSVPPAINLSK